MAVTAVAQHRRGVQRCRNERCWFALTASAAGSCSSSPRWAVTRNVLPSKDCAAVAPRQTINRGRKAWISAISQGWHATTSVRLGFWCIRRLPVLLNLKCFTALVCYVRSTTLAAPGWCRSRGTPDLVTRDCGVQVPPSPMLSGSTNCDAKGHELERGRDLCVSVHPLRGGAATQCRGLAHTSPPPPPNSRFCAVAATNKRQRPHPPESGSQHDGR